MMIKFSQRNSVLFIGLTALAVRAALLVKKGEMSLGGDSREYLRFAKLLAEGDLSGVRLQPLYQFYPLLLAPLYQFGISVDLYTAILHAIISSLTVICLYFVASRFLNPKEAFFVGVAGCFFPSFLFWMPYVLSDTPFLLVLALFLWAWIKLLQELTLKTFLVALGAAFIVLISRPVSITLVPVAGLTVLIRYLVAKRQVSMRSAILSSIGASVLATVILIVSIVSSPSVSSKILQNPTVTALTSIAVRLDTNDIRAYEVAIKDISNYADGLGTVTDTERKEALSRYALTWIADHPAQFVGMVAKRMVAFWFPGVFQSGWSTSHKMIDLAIAIALLSGTILCVYFARSHRFEIFALILGAGSFSVLSALTHMDTDGRYRVPSELILLTLAVPGFLRLLNKRQSRVS